MCSVAGHHSIRSHATEDDEVSSSKSKSSYDEGDGMAEDGNAREDKGGIETSSDGQVASDGEEGQEHPHTQDTLTPKTPSPVLVRSLVDMRTWIQSQTPERKSSLSGKSGTKKALRRAAP